DLGTLNHLSRRDRNLRSNCHLVALGPDQLEQHAMVVVFAHIQKQLRWPIHIERDNINVPIVVEVAESRASPRGVRNAGKHSGDVLKRTVALIAKKLHWLAIARGTGNLVHLRINMAIDQERSEEHTSELQSLA